MSDADRFRSHLHTRFAWILTASGLLLHLGTTAPELLAGSPQSVAQSRAGGGRVRPAAARQPVDVSGPRRPPVPWDNGTYRATVVVRRGTSQGSGTIIASVDGETLVLTAAHVVKAPGPIFIELHRYNLGMERRPTTPGVWPRVIEAAPAAIDTAADLAIVRIEKLAALPYVARFTRDHVEPPLDSIVTSIGIDMGLELTRWSSRLVESVSFELNDSRTARPFLITEKIPRHGRSGGGLFLDSGELVGVCIGHAELVKGRPMGVFAASESIRRLLDAHQLTATVVRSELRRARLEQVRSATSRVSVPAISRSVVTPTRTVGGETSVASTP